jgi:hypothetical protein
MRSLGTRRAVQVAGAATVAVIALAGCSAGQTAETSVLEPPVSGLNTASPDGALLIRNLQVAYNSTQGYPAGATAPLEMSLFNQTENPITVTITPATQAVTTGVVTASQIGLVGSASGQTPITGSTASPSENSTATELPSNAATPAAGGSSAPSGVMSPSSAPSVSGSASPSGSASSSASPSAQPASITIPALGSAIFIPGDQSQSLQAIGLSGALVPGYALALAVQSGGTTMNLLAPVAIPLSPASRAPGVPNENSDEG